MFNARGEFRPWGNFYNIFQGGRGGRWFTLGCASTEDRCRAIFDAVTACNLDGPKLVFRIDDPLSTFTDQIDELTEKNVNYIVGDGAVNVCLKRLELTASFSHYESIIKEFLNNVGNDNIILDITSLPKKVYFFLIKALMQHEGGPRNVVCTYTEPATYSKEPLAANPDPWEALPGFRLSVDNDENRKVVIAIGYEPLGLPDLVESRKFDEATISFLFPFPAQPDRINRNWRFIREIFPNVDSQRLIIKRVDGVNVPEVFDVLTDLGDQGETGLTMAPYGPKPVSLAMALYAAKHSSGDKATGVYYTQPTYYNPHYSNGIRVVRGIPSVSCYFVKIDGNFVY